MTNPHALLMSALDERNTKRFERAMALLERYEADAVILKVEQKDVTSLFSDVFDAGYKKLVSEKFTYNGQWEALNEDERKLEQALSHVYVHVVAGYLKRVAGAVKADGPMRDVMITYFTAINPLAERVLALKDKVGKRPPAATKTSIERDERDAKAMTCQCCARKILAETGVIAHHGYERPAGWGYQTASCEGAKELPFEVSRDALLRMLQRMEAYAENLSLHHVRVGVETADIPFGYTDISKKVRSWDRGIKTTIQVNRTNFDAKIAEIAPLRGPHVSTPSFAELKAAALHDLAREIEMMNREIERQQARYDAWTQTHERSGDAWTLLKGAAA